MTWTDLAFLHWQVPFTSLRRLVPPQLELDKFGDVAWLGITPFRITDVRPVAMPPLPTMRDFPELNVRTYVRCGSRAGVYFFSLDAASWLAVRAARAATGLPYFHARMSSRASSSGIQYESRRTHPGVATAEFRARYWPTGEVFRSEPGSLEHFLTERYSLFVTRFGLLTRLDIEHAPWPLQPATADIETNTMASAAGVELPSEQPHVLFVRSLDVVAHWPALMQPLLSDTATPSRPSG